jgi:hypothetical protein
MRKAVSMTARRFQLSLPKCTTVTATAVLRLYGSLNLIGGATRSNALALVDQVIQSGTDVGFGTTLSDGFFESRGSWREIVKSIATSGTFELMGHSSEFFPVFGNKELRERFYSLWHLVYKHFDDIREIGIISES